MAVGRVPARGHPPHAGPDAHAHPGPDAHPRTDADAGSAHAHARADVPACTRSSAGDTLVRIARRFKTSGRSIAYWNRATYPSLDPESAAYRPDLLKAGWVLQILQGQEYVPPPDDGESGIEVTPVPSDDGGVRHGQPLTGSEPGRLRLTAYPPRMSPVARRPPRIVVTLMTAARQTEPGIAVRKNALYVDSVVRHGAAAIALDATSPASDRAAAFAIDGRPPADRRSGPRSGPVRRREPGLRGRWSPTATSWRPLRGPLAEARGIPVLGICRGLQAMNVFGGGTLLQHVDGHAGAGWGHGAALTHPLRLVPGTRLARILSPSGVGGSVLTVNSYHHQAVRASDLAPRYVASGCSPSAAGDLVEAFEGREGPFRMAVQCHPERTESTPEGVRAAVLVLRGCVPGAAGRPLSDR